MAARLQLDDRAIVRGYRAGMTSMAPAREFGCAQPAILRRLREAGVVVRWGGKRPRQVPDPQRFDPRRIRAGRAYAGYDFGSP